MNTIEKIIQPKSTEEIEALKQEWLTYPEWEIEDVEGFEAHRDELREFRVQKERDWELERLKADIQECKQLGCSPQLLSELKSIRYIWRNIEKRLTKLEGYD